MSDAAAPTMVQRRVLEYLSRARELQLTPSLSEVGRRFGLSKSRIRNILRSLYRRGLLSAPTTRGLFCDHVIAAEPTPCTDRAPLTRSRGGAHHPRREAAKR